MELRRLHPRVLRGGGVLLDCPPPERVAVAQGHVALTFVSAGATPATTMTTLVVLDRVGGAAGVQHLPAPQQDLLTQLVISAEDPDVAFARNDPSAPPVLLSRHTEPIVALWFAGGRPSLAAHNDAPTDRLFALQRDGALFVWEWCRPRRGTWQLLGRIEILSSSPLANTVRVDPSLVCFSPDDGTLVWREIHDGTAHSPLLLARTVRFAAAAEALDDTEDSAASSAGAEAHRAAGSSAKPSIHSATLAAAAAALDGAAALVSTTGSAAVAATTSAAALYVSSVAVLALGAQCARLRWARAARDGMWFGLDGRSGLRLWSVAQRCWVERARVAAAAAAAPSAPAHLLRVRCAAVHDLSGELVVLDAAGAAWCCTAKGLVVPDATSSLLARSDPTWSATPLCRLYGSRIGGSGSESEIESGRGEAELLALKHVLILLEEGARRITVYEATTGGVLAHLTPPKSPSSSALAAAHSAPAAEEGGCGETGAGAGAGSAVNEQWKAWSAAPHWARHSGGGASPFGSGGLCSAHGLWSFAQLPLRTLVQRVAEGGTDRLAALSAAAEVARRGGACASRWYTAYQIEACVALSRALNDSAEAEKEESEAERGSAALGDDGDGDAARSPSSLQGGERGGGRGRVADRQRYVDAVAALQPVMHTSAVSIALLSRAAAGSPARMMAAARALLRQREADVDQGISGEAAAKRAALEGFSQLNETLAPLVDLWETIVAVPVSGESASRSRARANRSRSRSRSSSRNRSRSRSSSNSSSSMLRSRSSTNMSTATAVPAAEAEADVKANAAALEGDDADAQRAVLMGIFAWTPLQTSVAEACLIDLGGNSSARADDAGGACDEGGVAGEIPKESEKERRRCESLLCYMERSTALSGLRELAPGEDVTSLTQAHRDAVVARVSTRTTMTSNGHVRRVGSALDVQQQSSRVKEEEEKEEEEVRDARALEEVAEEVSTATTVKKGKEEEEEGEEKVELRCGAWLELMCRLYWRVAPASLPRFLDIVAATWSRRSGKRAAAAGAYDDGKCSVRKRALAALATSAATAFPPARRRTAFNLAAEQASSESAACTSASTSAPTSTPTELSLSLRTLSREQTIALSALYHTLSEDALAVEVLLRGGQWDHALAIAQSGRGSGSGSTASGRGEAQHLEIFHSLLRVAVRANDPMLLESAWALMPEGFTEPASLCAVFRDVPRSSDSGQDSSSAPLVAASGGISLSALVPHLHAQLSC